MTDTKQQARAEHVESAAHCNSALRVVWAPPGAIPEDVRDPAFLAKVAERHPLRPFDRIEVRGHGRDWRVELTITGASAGRVEVHIDRVTSLAAIAELGDNDGVYRIEHVGGSAPWAVIRVRDGLEMPERFAAKSAALLARARLYPAKVA